MSSDFANPPSKVILHRWDTPSNTLKLSVTGRFGWLLRKDNCIEHDWSTTLALQAPHMMAAASLDSLTVSQLRTTSLSMMTAMRDGTETEIGNLTLVQEPSMLFTHSRAIQATDAFDQKLPARPRITSVEQIWKSVVTEVSKHLESTRF